MEFLWRHSDESDEKYSLKEHSSGYELSCMSMLFNDIEIGRAFLIVATLNIFYFSSSESRSIKGKLRNM